MTIFVESLIFAGTTMVLGLLIGIIIGERIMLRRTENYVVALNDKERVIRTLLQTKTKSEENHAS